MTKNPKKIAPNTLTFKIGHLWGSPEGTTEKITLDAAVNYDPQEINAASHLTGNLMLIKLKEELSALVDNIALDIHVNCTRCIKPFIHTIKIAKAEREFLAHPPGKLEDRDDIFLIDMKAMSIDLSEMLRQEIILHFPLVQVCSLRCKGLCQYCGKDRNKSICQCKDQDATIYKPFKDLKKLLS